MRCLYRTAGVLLRRRFCSGPLLLFGLFFLCYQTLKVGRNRSGSEEVLTETGRLISALEALQNRISAQRSPRVSQAVVLTGQHRLSDTEVRLHQLVLQQMDYEIHMSRYAETSRFLRTPQGVGGWSLLLCLSSSEQSCLRRINFSHLQQHQMVNFVPGLMKAFSDAGGGVCHFYTHSHLTESDLPMMPQSCGLSSQNPDFPRDSRFPVQALPPALVAMVNVYVLVTSMTPLTSFLHDIITVTTTEDSFGRKHKIRDFLLQQLGPKTSHHALEQIKNVIGVVLQAASTTEKQEAAGRCVLCFQLLTFTLLLSGSSTPVVIQIRTIAEQVDTELTFNALRDDKFTRQITKDHILEDTLHFLLRPTTHLSSETLLSSETHLSSETLLLLEKLREKYGGCRGTHGSCLSQEDFLLLLLRFEQQLRNPSAFHTLCPITSSSGPLGVSDLLLRISRYYKLQTISRADGTNKASNQLPESSGACVDPRLRQIYTDPLLVLTPPFTPDVKEYRAEVTFDTLTVRIRPEPVGAGCRVHMDEDWGPRTGSFPLGLGTNLIRILVTDAAGLTPVVMTTYTLHVSRDSRPCLPMFGEHVMCSFLQDCGLLVQPGLPCGLQPHILSQGPLQTCGSGHVPGRWVVPCLSCSDNRTCDWRAVAWQPDGCSHLLVPRPLLQDCLTDRKVLFIGDSTTRGMMFYLMERVNFSLEDWGKAHDTLVYPNLNGGRTQISYSYYPQFWLDKTRRPTFRTALLQLIHRSRPLPNSMKTVLVVGGVQWLNTNHLRTVQEVLDRESLENVLVVVKSLGMGFHLPVDGLRSVNLVGLCLLRTILSFFFFF
ncbi:cadherin-like and PC-esterase domain-containing protein 1 [Nematolebias whitei]|uniref:cadherin-like and PC-esterase domain-containing protein 1 n=1 Tax=Nematolebias whitei TaxID=451745 RepID=UPI001899310E|nr:cadherin-like and PC-esterase domain-containing protein 1 [Nematolebias whitei]